MPERELHKQRESVRIKIIEEEGVLLWLSLARDMETKVITKVGMVMAMDTVEAIIILMLNRTDF